jgi:ribosomal protein S12 methylthiotransferase
MPAPISSSSTRGFIDAAVAESLDAIGEALAENGKVIVTGCLGAKNGGAFIRDAHPSVLAVTGPHATAEVMARCTVTSRSSTTRSRPRAAAGHQAHAAALRVPQDQRRLQPSLHVLHHPVDARRPREQADRRSPGGGRAAAASRRQELLVISQDTSAYGVDVKYRTGFWQGRPLKTRMVELATALDTMARASGAWVRLRYVYPYPHVDDVIERMTTDPAHGGLLPYLDVPFQHASPRILKLMKRPANAEGTLRRIEAWRAASDLVIRSTFIAGFPGETEREFEELLAFLGRRSSIASAASLIRRSTVPQRTRYRMPCRTR